MSFILCRRMTLVRSGFFLVLVMLGTLAGKFTDLSYTSLTSAIDSLKGDFVSVSTAQALYGHPLVTQVDVISEQHFIGLLILLSTLIASGRVVV